MKNAARTRSPATHPPARARPAVAPVRRTQTERREEAERRLLDAALAIVARTGTVRLTLAEVGEAAGYSRGLPAHRFGSKAGLLRALVAHIHERFQDQLQAAPARQPGLDAIRGNIEQSRYIDRLRSRWVSDDIETVLNRLREIALERYWRQ